MSCIWSLLVRSWICWGLGPWTETAPAIDHDADGFFKALPDEAHGISYRRCSHNHKMHHKRFSKWATQKAQDSRDLELARPSQPAPSSMPGPNAPPSPAPPLPALTLHRPTPPHTDPYRPTPNPTAAPAPSPHAARPPGKPRLHLDHPHPCAHGARIGTILNMQNIDINFNLSLDVSKMHAVHMVNVTNMKLYNTTKQHVQVLTCKSIQLNMNKQDSLYIYTHTHIYIYIYI
jgi:hypothetical protein